MNVGSYFYSDKLALSMSRARPLGKEEHPALQAIVAELAEKMNIPMPKLYITPDQQANAFATGRDPNHASVAVTQGIMHLLDKDQLRGVLAHELSHVKNRDILIATIAAVMASTISYIANMAMWTGFGGNRDEEDRGSGALALLAVIVVPIAATLIQLAISRQREFGADESGAKTIGDGEPLAYALLAINKSASQHPMKSNPALSSLYIGNPMGRFGEGLMHLFSTHPPVEERVKRLEKI
jgi:heat shock protein HtpX